MKPVLERIEPGFESSFTIRKFSEVKFCENPYWHFHPEFEIVYISNGRGKRHIGDHISYYQDGDLIFLGPDLPHFSFTQELIEEHSEIVVQMKDDFLGKDFLHRPEMKAIRQLWERARQGISFYGETKRIVGERLERMLTMNRFDRLIELLSIFQIMARSEEYHLLKAKGFALEVNAQDYDRMSGIYQYVEENFRGRIQLEVAAAEANMTVPAFCRYFKRLTRKTFTQFVNEFRVAYACKLLAEDHQTIASVSYESGFNNLSHFNKQFRLVTGESPTRYRANVRKMVG